MSTWSDEISDLTGKIISACDDLERTVTQQKPNSRAVEIIGKIAELRQYANDIDSAVDQLEGMMPDDDYDY